MLEKVIQVSMELCTGCGSCIDVCSAGAIHLVDHQAEIDDTLCEACEVCLEACPNGAIIAITAPGYAESTGVRPVAVPGLALGQQPIVLPETTVPVRGLKPLAGAALSFLGSEVAPRLVDVLIKSIERRLAQSTATSISPLKPYPRGLCMQSRGQRKQIRRRGGSMGVGKHRGRR